MNTLTVNDIESFLVNDWLPPFSRPVYEFCNDPNEIVIVGKTSGSCIVHASVNKIDLPLFDKSILLDVFFRIIEEAIILSRNVHTCDKYMFEMIKPSLENVKIITSPKLKKMVKKFDYKVSDKIDNMIYLFSSPKATGLLAKKYDLNGIMVFPSAIHALKLV